MRDSRQEVTAPQGAQPTLAGLRIGIIAVGSRNGEFRARLLLRPESGDEAVIMSKGESKSIPGYGLLTLQDVSTEGKGSVTLSHNSEQG